MAAVMGMKGPAYAVLPILTLGLHAVGLIARTTRSSMLDTINQDYIRTSKARGVSRFKIIMSHTLKNALIPILTAIGPALWRPAGRRRAGGNGVLHPRIGAFHGGWHQQP